MIKDKCRDKFCVVRVVPNPWLPLAYNCCRNNGHKRRALAETALLVCVEGVPQVAYRKD